MIDSLKILLVNESSHEGNNLEPIFADLGIDVSACIKTSDHIISSVSQHQVKLLVVFTESPSQTLMNQLHHLNRDHPIPIVIFTETDEHGLINRVIKAGVSAYIVDGFAAHRIIPILEIALARFEQNQTMRIQLQKSQEKLEERIIIDKAKGIIMKSQGFTEDEAYRTLRKLAMDKNQRLYNVAKDVISLSELIL